MTPPRAWTWAHATGRDVTTFAELVGLYADVYRVPPADPSGLYRLAEAVAGEFPADDLREHLPHALERATLYHAPGRVPFPAFFAGVLRQRFRRAAARRAARTRRRRAYETVYHVTLRGRTVEGDDPTSGFGRWADHLLAVATRRLDATAQTYVRLLCDGSGVSAIAAANGVRAGSLSNRFGGDKLAERLRREVDRAVAALPAGHLCLLVAHLRHEAGLSDDEVARLLGMRVAVGDAVPVLEEDELLTLLGWHPDYLGKSRKSCPGDMRFRGGAGRTACEHPSASRPAG